LAPALSAGSVATSGEAASAEVASGALAELAPHASASREDNSSPVAAGGLEAVKARPKRARLFPAWTDCDDEVVMTAAA
jgi:hypothetical protein